MTKMTGTVTISLEEYNKMLLRLNALENMVTVKKGYSEEPEIEFNLKPLEGQVREMFNAQGFDKTYTLRTADRWYLSTYSMCDKIEKEGEESK